MTYNDALILVVYCRISQTTWWCSTVLCICSLHVDLRYTYLNDTVCTCEKNIYLSISDKGHKATNTTLYCIVCKHYTTKTKIHSCITNKSSPKSFGKSASLSHNYATKSPLVIQWDAPNSPPKLLLPLQQSPPPSNTSVPPPTVLTIPNGIRI